MKKFILFFIIIFCIGSFIPTQAYTHIDQYYKQCGTGYGYNDCSRKTYKSKNSTKKNKQSRKITKKVNNRKFKTSTYKHKKCKFGRCYAKVK